MTRSASRSGCAVLCAILLAAACSDEPEPTAPEPPPVTPVEPVNPDRAALVALYNSTTGSVWQQDRNWNTVADIGTWYGVDTNSAGRVIGLVLDDNNLVGTLPPELGSLAQLERLVLNGNRISGRIPPELGNLTNLTMLTLRTNSLEGPIPSELGALARISHTEPG